MQNIILTQRYEILVVDAKNHKKEVKSIPELRDYIKSISSQLEPDITHMVSITRRWNITQKDGTVLPLQILGSRDRFRDFDFFVVNGKIPNVSQMSEYIKSKGYNVFPAQDNMKPNAFAYHEIGFDPNLYLLGNNIVTDMDLKQIRPHSTSKEPTALTRFFAPVVINNRLKLR